jgi:hypothetical protein
VRARVKLDRVERAIDVADKSWRSSLTARRHLGGRYERDVEGGKRAESRRSTRPRSGCAGGSDLDGECGRGGVVRVMEGRAATACGIARKSPSQRHAARGLVAMSDVSTCRVALANAAA